MARVGLWLLLPSLLGAWSAAQQCEPILVPMCRGLLSYTHTRLPRGMTQGRAQRELDALWPFMDLGCSSNLRTLACGTFLPQCPPSGSGAGWKPCKEVCQNARRCRDRMTALKFTWPQAFSCNRLRQQRRGQCVPAVAESSSCNRDHVTCSPTELPLCRNLIFTHGASPNMFLQCNNTELQIEMDQFQALIRANCHADFRFFLCGVYKPFCSQPDSPFALPCRELCEDIRTACEETYRRLNGGLAWPSKFQCHRYPNANDANHRCVMPTDSPSTLRTE